MDLIDGRLPTQSVRIDVVELDEPALIAPVTVRSDESATSQIPQPVRRRTDAGTSGRGESVATTSSTSGFLLPRAESSTSQ
jgi:hypothetical protein